MYDRFITLVQYCMDQGYRQVTGQIDGRRFDGTLEQLFLLLASEMHELANTMVYRWLRPHSSAVIEGDGINLTISK